MDLKQARFVPERAVERTIDTLPDKRAKIENALKNYLGDPESLRNLERLFDKSGYVYDHGALLKGLMEPSSYMVLDGGKRVRPLTTMFIIDALGGDSRRLVEFAIIPEVVHNGTLILDDIQDGSETRRGKDAVHKKFGLDIGSNLGVFLQTFPVVATIDSDKIDEKTKKRMLAMWARETTRVTIGQAIDIVWHRQEVDPRKITEEKYLQMALDKNGTLKMAAQLGAILAGASDEVLEAMGRFGARFGVAFQLQDDVLNLEKSRVTASKGKIGDDITEGKISLLVVYTLQQAPKEVGDELVGILKEHTREPQKIRRAIEILKSYDAVERVRELQRRMVSEAFAILDNTLPLSPERVTLKMFVDVLVFGRPSEGAKFSPYPDWLLRHPKPGPISWRRETAPEWLTGLS